VIPKEVKSVETPNVVPTEIKLLLDELKEIILNDLPKGLPPVKSISHQIDLILRSILPNKETCRMNPMERKDVTWKVHKLLDRGLIHEILSPCAVPTLLTPKKTREW
jgi:hypothetical protein